MHPNPTFRTDEAALTLDFARSRGIGTLAVDGPLLAHIPFLLSEAGDLAEFHLVRSNPIARALTAGPMPARIAVTGPHGYISPDWYGAEDQVPTWNYVAVHLVGEVTLCPAEGLPDLLARQSAHFERMLAPKPEWTLDKMSPDALAKMLRMIVPCRMTVSAAEGTWKLGQNKPDAVRERAAAELGKSPIGDDTAALAGLMKQPPLA